MQNTIEYAVVLAKENVITEDSLPPELLLPPELQEPLSVLPGFASAANGANGAVPVPTLAEADGTSLNLDERERRAILQALVQTHGNKLKAAKILGIHRPTLYNKMKRYGIAV